MNIDTYVMIFQFFLGLTIIVGLHELGHMFFAIFFGMRVEEYSIGFPPKILKFKYKNTEYSLGLIPLGGFVKISGMIDESLISTKTGMIDESLIHIKPKSWEFRSKPAWQRLIVMMGGIIFNIITGVIIYILISFYLGDSYIEKNKMNKHGVLSNFIGKKIGFLNGDRIFFINGFDFKKYEDILDLNFFLSSNTYYTVYRFNNELLINIPSNVIQYISNSKDLSTIIEPLIPFQINSIENYHGAFFSDLKKNDRIIEINGFFCLFFQNLLKILNNNFKKEIGIKYIRNNKLYFTSIKVNEFGKLGFIPNLLFTSKNNNYTFLESILVGSKKAFSVLWLNIIGFSNIASGQISASKSLSGPIGILKIFSGSFNLIHFLSITAFLSMALAFINILPIPILDGGHIIFILYEIFSKKKVSYKVLHVSQKIGFLILVFIVIYTIFNDIYKLL